jgi:flagellar motor switch protein FliM
MSEQILSQDEVDALLSGMGDDGEHAAGASRLGRGLRNHDFAKQGRLTRMPMPALEAVHERFARELRLGLFSLTRKMPEVTVGELRTLKFSAFVNEIALPVSFNVLAASPLRGSALLVCDPALVFFAVDALFGGQGKFPARIDGRDFSPTEQRVIARLVETVCAQYTKAWAGTYPLALTHQRSEMQPRFVNVAAPGDMVIATAFTVQFGETTSTLHLCMPYAMLEPIRQQLCTSAPGDDSAPDQRWLTVMTQQVQRAQVELVVELAHTPATVEQLLAFKPGDFIELDLQKIIEAKIDGVPVLTCHYGASSGKYAVRVEQLLTHSDDWTGERHVG